MEEQKKLTDDDFYMKYTVQYNHFAKKSLENGSFDARTTIEDMAPYNGCMYETYGEELAYVLKVQKEYPDRVWTIIDNNSGWTGICPGYHLVDRQGYLITDQSCPEEDKDVEYTVYDTTELRKEWESLPIWAVERITGTELKLSQMTEDQVEEFRDDEFYVWEELGEDERKAYLEEYKNYLKKEEDGIQPDN